MVTKRSRHGSGRLQMLRGWLLECSPPQTTAAGPPASLLIERPVVMDPGSRAAFRVAWPGRPSIRITSMSDSAVKFVEVGEGAAARRIAVRLSDGASPGLFWLGGFKSDMKGTKAEALNAWAARHGRACTRFDYSGHGES